MCENENQHRDKSNNLPNVLSFVTRYLVRRGDLGVPAIEPHSLLFLSTSLYLLYTLLSEGFARKLLLITNTRLYLLSCSTIH